MLAGTHAAVNAVSLYVERGQETFHSVHVEAAERVAVQAHRVGVERLAHVSGLGADAASPSLYIRKRGEGELAVKAAFTDVILFRPAVMFGPDDAFLTTILELLRRLPIYPMFGRGRTRLQPAYVEDVAEAIARALQRTQTHAITFECGGPRVYSYEELLRALAREADLKRILIPLPFAAWRALAWTAELFPNPPVGRVPADGHDFWMAQYGRLGASGENQTEESASNGGNRPRPPIRRVPFAGVCPASGLL